MPGRSSRRKRRTLIAAAFIVSAILFLCLVSAGCGQATPEETVYKFLGAVQSHDFDAMRSCVNPEAVLKVEERESELTYTWDELYRRYQVEPITWRMDFESIRLDSSYLDETSTLIRINGGRCKLYNLEDERWQTVGEIDFSQEDFSPLYVVEKDGCWYLEALDLHIVYGLESAARM
jgi:hypothetical protein